MRNKSLIPLLFSRAEGNQRALSLIEVVISTVILGLMTSSIITSIVFTSRTARVNSNAFAAKNIAQGYFERMAVDNFTSVTKQYYPDVNYDSNPPVYLDQGLGITCKVTIDIKGFGTVTQASANSITDANAKWNWNEWKNDTLYITAGRDLGEFVQIDSNTSQTLILQKKFFRIPDTTTEYMINNGKTVMIITEWKYIDKTYTQSVESLVVKR